MTRFWSRGILSGPVEGPRSPSLLPPVREVVAAVGLEVVHRGSRFRGVVARLERDGVVLRSRNTGLERVFALHPQSFSLEGETVTLVRPRPVASPGTARTASGSLAPSRSAARVARAGRILVEGVHDAELVEKVWGDDLRVEGIVVERLDGIDALPDVVRAFGPHAGARLGVLVDHLVEGSKEARIAASVRHPAVLVSGTPFVDVWQAVKPSVAGIAAWPVVPYGQPWKEGVCAALGQATVSTGAYWRLLLGRVRTYADLEPALVGAVESLIDFVTSA